MSRSAIQISLPDWAETYLANPTRTIGDKEQMRLAIALARENVIRNTGGPFGAAVFEVATGRLVSVGVNSVERLSNSVLHAEIMALMFGESDVGSFSLHGDNMPELALVTSCEPCAMCLGAILWSGVRRVVCGATRDDAVRIGFDEGPVFPESYEYLGKRGLTFVHGSLRTEANAVLESYRAGGGLVYNG